MNRKIIVSFIFVQNIDLDFYIDIHSHSIHTNGGLFENVSPTALASVPGRFFFNLIKTKVGLGTRLELYAIY